MELDLEQFFRDLLKKYGVEPDGSSGGPPSKQEFEQLVSDLAEHATDFRNMP